MSVPSPSFTLQVNPHRQQTIPEPPSRQPLAFHRRMPGYAPTPLVSAPELATHLGVGQLWIKDESSRLGLPAFKVLGASWATVQAITSHLRLPLNEATSLDDLRQRLADHSPLTLVAATDGNHGRAVARMAHLLGLRSRILVPAGMAPARIDAIRSEGAAIQTVNGTYDEAVELAASLASHDHLVIADTAWPGYEQVPQWVIDGYSTILWEVDDALAIASEPWPDLTFVQIGVGALAAAVTWHLRQPDRSPHGRLVGVEPTTAACLYASIAAGELVDVPGPHDSTMAGLNCGVPSSIAWPVLAAGVDVFVTIDDEWSHQAMRDLASAGVIAGETGAAGLGGLLAILSDPVANSRLGITADTRVLVFNTEGPTDPNSYARIVS